MLPAALEALFNALEKLAKLTQDTINVQMETSKQMIALGQDNEILRLRMQTMDLRLDSLERSRENNARSDGD